MELAMLAAILRSSTKNSADAFTAAMEWYFEGVLVTREGKFEQALLKRSRGRLLQLLARRYLRGVPVQAGADTVDLDGARRLLDNTRELGKVLRQTIIGFSVPVGEVVKELPGVYLKTDAALKKAILAGMQYMLRTLGFTDAGLSFEERFEVSKGVYKIPVSILLWVLRCRHESHLERDRQYQRRKRRKQGRDKAVK
jgi:hypothetical protein